MKKLFITALCLISNACFAYIGSIDKREYVDWSSPVYNKIVAFFTSGGGQCTAQYVAPDIILTARHCVTNESTFDNFEKIGNKYEILTHDGRRTQVTLEGYGQSTFKFSSRPKEDWALLRVTDPSFYSTEFFDVAKKTIPTKVENTGFGFLRILSDTEIQEIKKLYTESCRESVIESMSNLPDNPFLKEYMIAQGTQYCDFNDTMERTKAKMAAAGIPDLNDIERQITINNNPTNIYRLKSHKDCDILSTKTNYENEFASNCQTIPGNSGGAYFADNTLYGIVSNGENTWDDKDTDNKFGCRTEVFIKELKKLKKHSQNNSN